MLDNIQALIDKVDNVEDPAFINTKDDAIILVNKYFPTHIIMLLPYNNFLHVSFLGTTNEAFINWGTPSKVFVKWIIDHA